MRKTQRLAWMLIPVFAVACLWTAPVGAAETRPKARASAKTSATNPPSGARVTGPSFTARNTSILGVAWNADNSPIKQPSIRLRNVVTGQVAGLTKGNDTGQFAFENIEGGSYVVELLSDAGKIQTVGHVFTIAQGETVATFVRLGNRDPWAAAFFTNTAAAVASSAASQGITALVPLGRCVSPPGCSH